MGDIELARRALKYFKEPYFASSVKLTLVLRANDSMVTPCETFGEFRLTSNPIAEGTITMSKEEAQKIYDALRVGTIPFFSEDKGGEK